MAGIDIPKEAMIAAVVVGGLVYLQSLKTAGGIGRSLKSGTRGLYRDVKSTYRTGYRDVAKPIGGEIKSLGSGAKKQARKLGRWLRYHKGRF